MTDNHNRIQFEDMPREDQDRIAGAIARGEKVEFWNGGWHAKTDAVVYQGSVYRIPPAAKPSPVREVTRKEIVPGQYGKVSVSYAWEGVNGVWLALVDPSVKSDFIGYTQLNCADLTAAIDTLTEIRDAMVKKYELVEL